MDKNTDRKYRDVCSDDRCVGHKGNRGEAPNTAQEVIVVEQFWKAFRRKWSISWSLRIICS